MFPTLLPPCFKDDVKRWIQDDCPSFDVGGFVVGDEFETAHIYCKSSGVLSGVPFVNAVFEHLDLNFHWVINEGTFIDVSKEPSRKVIVAEISGKCRNILLSERTALNILSRASGVATQSRNAVKIAEGNNWSGHIAGTRKTTPGFREVEKYSLLVGGAATHRLDLSQMVMLKDNHIVSSGSITAAVLKAKSVSGFSIKIEVECQSVSEGLEAASAGADIIMLDNFSAANIAIAAKEIKSQYPNVLIEASGGITRESIHLFMHPEIDIISQGCLTQGYPCADYSMKISPKSL